ncbi:cytochrome P450 family protein [Actinokineospora iranica]|uniref:Cytochrome P450 n=1 Tax=Actinokineospora iranica TaxID=1271860 RepID=A0A1G6KEQ5_9PSEU|nr:cytochrome P450 [Actinokineospora iranica]SDC29055.1 Cytochrome P450 [Actinokineospora iranica]
MSTTTTTLDEGFIQNPYPLYAELRETGPVRRILTAGGVHAWLVTRYADARAALADPCVRKDIAVMRELITRHRTSDSPLVQFLSVLSEHMLNTDPPDHTRLRKLVTKAFTSRRVERLRPRIEEITTDLLDDLAAHDEADLLDVFAFPLPMTVICELLGVPDTDRDSFRHWTSRLVATPMTEDSGAAAAAMTDYLTGLIATKRAAPADDLVTDLIHAVEDGDRLTEQELVAMVFVLLVAGHDTTVNLIGNAVLSLLESPNQLTALRADPTLLPSAIEEFLRFEGPVNLATLRYTAEAVTYSGVEIPAGELVLVSLSSANRDPNRFPNPDQLDVTRAPSAHLAFGHGIHYCVGAPLARLEAEIALGALLTRFPNLAKGGEPATTLKWRDSTLMRGLRALPVRPHG